MPAREPPLPPDLAIVVRKVLQSDAHFEIWATRWEHHEKVSLRRRELFRPPLMWPLLKTVAIASHYESSLDFALRIADYL